MYIKDVKKYIGKRVIIEELEGMFFGMIPMASTYPYECVIVDVIDNEELIKLSNEDRLYYRKSENIRILKVLD
jgi:hypothetical protein